MTQTKNLIFIFSCLLALGCAENQFTVSDSATEKIVSEDSSKFYSLFASAEDEDFPVDPDELSSGGKDGAHEKSGAVAESSPAMKPADNAWDFETETDDAKNLKGLAPAEDGEVEESGFLRPTVYFLPIIKEDNIECERSSKLIDIKGTKLIDICEKTRMACRLQGTCTVIHKDKQRSFNIRGRIEGRDRFFETTEAACVYGFGVKSSCLDPFYTVAADLSIYKPGDVIYLPTIRGLELPDGSKHSGYFIVRDSGRNIIGKARFDFYTGHISWRADENPFSRVGLANKMNRVPYMKIRGAKADAFKELRSFPKLPLEIVKH